MGYILNRFDKLKELQQDPKSTSKFKLTAIIVHDPNDVDLCNHIRKYFLKFAQTTGKNFLFITFIQPPKEYVDALKRGEYEYAKLIISDSSQGGDVERLSSPLLRNTYGLPESGSYIVVAKNLSDSCVYLIPVTKESLPYQFMQLSSYCDDPDDFESLIKELNAESFSVKDLMLDSVVKIVSLFSPSFSPDACRLSYDEQQRQAIETIKEEKQKLLDLVKQTSIDLTEKIISLYDIIEYAHMNVLKSESNNRPSKKCLNYPKLDGSSKKFWNTYSRLTNSLDGSDFDEMDYSAFILYLGKIVENELNLSVCQMLRHAMGIDMPSFYNRYCSAKGRVDIPTSRQSVSINKYKTSGTKKELEGVPLGNLLHAYLTMIGKEQSSHYAWEVERPEFLIELPDDMLVFWENFAKVRNDAAHSGEAEKKSYDKAKSFFQSFQKRYIENVSDIKLNLRPNQKHR